MLFKNKNERLWKETKRSPRYIRKRCTDQSILCYIPSNDLQWIITQHFTNSAYHIRPDIVPTQDQCCECLWKRWMNSDMVSRVRWKMLPCFVGMHLQDARRLDHQFHFQRDPVLWVSVKLWKNTCTVTRMRRKMLPCFVSVHSQDVQRLDHRFRCRWGSVLWVSVKMMNK
jgi:hypothetical protein